MTEHKMPAIIAYYHVHPTPILFHLYKVWVSVSQADSFNVVSLRNGDKLLLSVLLLLLLC